MTKVTIDDQWTNVIVERLTQEVCQDLGQNASLVRPVVKYFVQKRIFELIFVTDQKVKAEEHLSIDDLGPF